MRILVIGSGGREHTLVWKISKNPSVSRIFCMPGNGGISVLAECVADTDISDHPAVIQWVRDNSIDLVVVGPEQPLVEGLVDALTEAGIRAFGPVKKAAMLEGSKAFAKEIMQKFNVPTAASRKFVSFGEARSYIRTLTPPMVIKADGLAAGKGVIIPETLEEAEKALQELMVERKLGSAGDSVIIEEFMTGEEVSVLAFTDGQTILPMIGAQDHKNIFDCDKGPNTGGMGGIV
jgi:phosphoribosylamine---glycine ligase